jgi:two-component system response regulator RegA
MDSFDYDRPDGQASLGLVLIADPFIERTAPLASMFHKRGYDVIRTSTLANAMSACSLTPPDFVLTEMRFPDGSGMKLVHWIAEHLLSTRIIVHTWFADIPTAVAVTKAGADDLVPKPTDQEFLVSILLLGHDKVPRDCRIETPDRLRREYVEEIMRSSASNVSEAARKLHLHRRSLQRMLKRYEDEAPPRT